MDKLITFDPDLAVMIQKYANENFNGNFSMAVRTICENTLNKNK